MKSVYLILLGVACLASCSGNKEQTTEPTSQTTNADQITLTEAQLKNAGIQTAKLTDREMASKITLNGSIDAPPQGMASISAPGGGYVRVSKFMPGNYVKKGDVLAILEDPNAVQLQQDYLLAKSNLNYNQQDYQRQKALNQSQASSDKAMQMAQTEAQNQQINLKSLAQRLQILGINPESVSAGNIQKNIAVRSPISGYISAVNVNIGQYVSPTDRLFEVVNTSDRHLVLKVFEKDLGHLKPQQKVIAYTNQNPEQQYNAEIILIGQSFDADRSVPVHCHFVGKEPQLPPGTYMNADVETQSETGIVVPDDAIVTWEEKQYIFEEINPKTFRMFPVKIGNSENGYTEILAHPNILKSKKFVIKGAYQLLMGLKNIEE